MVSNSCGRITYQQHDSVRRLRPSAVRFRVRSQLRPQKLRGASLLSQYRCKPPMSLYSFDPLQDPRWARFVQGHPKASVFHTPGWLRSLQRTYRFVPIAFTTSGSAEELGNAMVFCGVRSWLTGDRLVSLPFSDHCEPLVRGDDELQALCLGVEQHRAAGRWKYAEIRPAGGNLPVATPFRSADTYYLHRLDLRSSADDLWRGVYVHSLPP